MYIIADVEWVENARGKTSPTQISAVRVDENWEIIDDFSSFVRPIDSSFVAWNHVAYTGGDPIDFLEASSCTAVFSKFVKWAGDDVICWWHTSSEKVYSYICRVVLRKEEPQAPVILRDHIFSFLDGERNVLGSAYEIARARGIEAPGEMHNSWNDVIAILNLFKGIRFPQDRLLLPPSKPVPHKKPATSKPKKRANADLRYQYDVASGLLHLNGCSLLPTEGDIRGYATLKKAIMNGYNACDCVKNELWQVKQDLISDEIKRTSYNYIYIPERHVFHRRDCPSLYNSVRILGSEKYKTAIESGRSPCKICRPTIEDEIFNSAGMKKKIEAMSDRKLRTQRLSRKEAVAVSRHEQARNERLSAGTLEGMTEQEKSDLFTLTQPRFGFFASRGYENFHTRNCYRLDGMKNIIGFDTFAHATKAGLTPCRSCKPTPKQDIEASIPFENKIRNDESVGDLCALAARFGYEYKLDMNMLHVTTPVGKWKISLSDRPVSIEHLNLVKKPYTEEYHKQPRIFLSMIDALRYIHRHDTMLADKGSDGLNGKPDEYEKSDG